MNFEGGNRKKADLIKGGNRKKADLMKGGIKFSRNMVRGERNYEFVWGGIRFLIIRKYKKVLNSFL